MGQVSYGTITITDTNDIEQIYMEYAQSTSNSAAPTSGWGTDIPTWEEGKYIWQRTVTKMSGVPLSSESYGEPVCLTGSTGSTGATGRGISSVTTTYCNYGEGTPADGYSGWQPTVPSYDSTKPNYWVKTAITYSNPTETIITKYKDNGITSANATAAAANTTAQAASGKADDAWNKADNAETIANNASSAISDLNQYFWRKKTASTNVPAGSYVTNIPGTTYEANPTQGGFNSLVQSTGIFLRNGITTLSSWTGDALTFYKPGTSNKGIELTSTILTFYNPANNSKAIELGTKDNNSILSFYNPSNDSISMMDLTSSGLIFKTSAGAEIGKFGSDDSGGLLELSGRLNIKGGGRIGQDSTNYWEFGDNAGYNVSQAAYLLGKGNASIQLGENGHWRIDKNRIHTGWYVKGDSTSSAPAGSLHFDTYNKDRTSTSSGDQYYWDYGLHFPFSNTTPSNNKFLYIRYSTGTVAATTLSQMKSRIDNDNYWNYKFYIDDLGNVHANSYYIGNTPLGGDAVVAGSLSSYGGSATQPVYFPSTGENAGKPVATTYQLNAAGAKGVITDLANNTTSTDLPTAAAVASYVTSRGYITSYVDEKVKTTQANTTKIYLSGTETTGTSTGTLSYDSGVYLTTTAGTLHATTFEGNATSATKATQDADGNTINTTYLKLSGGQVTGPVSFGDSVTIDEATIGDVVVNGNASFVNNAHFNSINGVSVGNSPKFTDTVTTVSTSGNGNAVTSITASNGALTIKKEVTFLSSESDPIFVASAAYNITSNDISTWNSKTSNTGTVTSVKVQGSNGLTGSGTITTSGTITISHSDTSNQASSSNSGRTYIQSITLDDYGHVTGLSTATETVINTHNTAYLYAGKSNGTTNEATTNGNTYLILMDGGSATTRHKISGSGTVSVASDANGNITITGSAHPTSLKNPNALSIKVYNGNSTSSDISYDGSTAGQSVSVAGTNAVIGVSSNTDGKLILTKADGTQSDPITVKITATTSDSAASADKLNLSANVGSVTQPVYFDANTGLPKTIDYTIQTSVPQNAVFTDTWNKVSTSQDGYITKLPGNTTSFLRGDGTWAVPGGTYSLPLAANGTRGGVQIGYTTSGKNYAVQLSSEKMYVNVPWTDTTYSAGTGLSLSGTTFSNTGVTGIKGNSESSYRTGQVNLTAANIGAIPTYTNGNTQYLYRPIQLNGCNDNTLDQKISFLRGNRLLFLPADQIIIEKTTDGGTTWVDAGYNDIQKRHLFAETQGSGIGVPLLNGVRDIKCGLRITITGMKYNVPDGTTETQKYNYWNSNYVKSTERYSNLKELYFWVSTANAGLSCKVERATGASPNNWAVAYDSGSTFALTGWSGNDYVRFGQSVFGGGTTQTGNYWNYRFTFFQRNSTGGNTLPDTYTNSAGTLYEIRGYGDTAWTKPNNFMANDHIYTWDVDQNVTFPGKIYGNISNDIDGNAIKTTYVKVDGSNKMTGNLIIRKAGTGANDWASREQNPSLIFEATDGQTAGLVYTQYDSVKSPDSITVVGANAGTYFIAPNIQATGNFYGNLSGNATNVTGTVTVSHGGTGATSLTSGALLVGNGTNAVTTRGIRNNTTAGTLGWTSSTVDTVIPTVNTIAYWNGAYQNTSSNLAYCNKGAFGTAATYTASTSVGNDSYLPTGAAIQTYVSGVVGNYVTLNTSQILTAAGTKIYLGLQTYGSSGLTLGITSGSSVTQKANMKYDSTLEAIVFSFA